MCGIAGFVNVRKKGSYDILQDMGQAIIHRGPDDSGEYLTEDCLTGLAFRRLSIIDLSAAGHQPMSNSEGSIWIVFNGEIYNFKTLRSELIRLGYGFKSKTDTEVILNAYIEWGVDCLAKLNGMFAFAIWDSRTDKLFMARDRVGVKPFFYYHDAQQFIFASELKAIKKYPCINLDIEPTAIYDFLTYLYVPTPKTLYKNIFKLPPGHYAILEKGKLKVEQYWDVDLSNKISISEEEAIEEVKRLLSDSVGLQLVSDVPLGVFLSGGIDSSAVTALAQKQSSVRLQSFSIGFDVKEHSELPYAQMVSVFTNTSYNERIISKDMGLEIEEFIINLFDEPFADSSAIPTYFVSALAKEKVTVVLSGDGGDEVFGGYNWYDRWMTNQKRGSLKRQVFEIISKLYPHQLKGYEKVTAKSLHSLDFYAFLMGGYSKAQKQKVLNDQYKLLFNGYDPLWFFRKFWRDELDELTRMQYLDLKTYLNDDILTKVDRTSMANSIEARVPLLDHKLIEFVFSLPTEIRNKNYEKKYILKKALQDMLPAEVLYRKKKGFSIPANQWMPKNSGVDIPMDNSVFKQSAVINNASWLKGNKVWQMRVANKFS